MVRLSISAERRGLQIATALAACVPVVAGAWGIWEGTDFLDLPANVSADSHIRYLSGLLLGIGIAFWATIPAIETHSSRFSLLTAIIMVGGLARLSALVTHGVPKRAMVFGLVMELVITPAIWAWQRRVAQRCSKS